MWALNVQQSWRTPNVCAHPSYTPASTPGDQQVVHTARQLTPSVSHESIRSRVACYDYDERDPANGMSQRARLDTSGGGVGEVPTIFHPRRSLTSNVALGEEQLTRGPFAGPPVQIAFDASGKCRASITDTDYAPWDPLGNSPSYSNSESELRETTLAFNAKILVTFDSEQDIL